MALSPVSGITSFCHDGFQEEHHHNRARLWVADKRGSRRSVPVSAAPSVLVVTRYLATQTSRTLLFARTNVRKVLEEQGQAEIRRGSTYAKFTQEFAGLEIAHARELMSAF